MWLGEILHLPDCLWSAYRDVLGLHNLLASCIEGTTKKDIHGGPEQAAAQEHFVYRFANSASRLIYAVQPKSKFFRPVSTAVVTSFANKEIHVLDLAAGAGAGVIGILVSIVEMRNDGAIPTLPLNVSIYAADISSDALSIYREMLTNLDSTFRSCAINVSFKSQQWDATQPASANLLCNAWLSSVGSSEVFVLVSNLSGIGKALLDQFSRSFQHITERVSHLPNTLLWIEPPGKGAKTFLGRVAKLIFQSASWLTSSTSGDLEADYTWHHALQNGRNQLPGGVQLLSFTTSES